MLGPATNWKSAASYHIDGPSILPSVFQGLDIGTANGQPNLRDGVLSMPIPLGQLTEPDGVASLIAFLCSSEASAIHGSIYYIDGGTDAQIRPDRF